MNMKRGCQMRGFLNMRELEQRRKWEKNGRKMGEKEEFDMTILRPLLQYSKKDIQDCCDEQ
jgi:tRNA(Ile)-lysidine synthase TilS/MesJ